MAFNKDDVIASAKSMAQNKKAKSVSLLVKTEHQ